MFLPTGRNTVFQLRSKAGTLVFSSASSAWVWQDIAGPKVENWIQTQAVINGVREKWKVKNRLMEDILMTFNYEGKMLMFPLMPNCASAFRWLGCRAMAKCHVQQNCLIVIRTLKLRNTSTRHYPIEPLTNLKCRLIHMVKMSIDKHTTSRKLEAYISQMN